MDVVKFQKWVFEDELALHDFLGFIDALAKELEDVCTKELKLFFNESAHDFNGLNFSDLPNIIIFLTCIKYDKLQVRLSESLNELQKAEKIILRNKSVFEQVSYPLVQTYQEKDLSWNKDVVQTCSQIAGLPSLFSKIREYKKDILESLLYNKTNLHKKFERQFIVEVYKLLSDSRFKSHSNRFIISCEIVAKIEHTFGIKNFKTELKNVTGEGLKKSFSRYIKENPEDYPELSLMLGRS